MSANGNELSTYRGYHKPIPLAPRRHGERPQLSYTRAMQAVAMACGLVWGLSSAAFAQGLPAQPPLSLEQSKDPTADPELLRASNDAEVEAQLETTPPIGLVAKTVLGLVLLMALVWAGAHPWVRRLEEILGIRQAITAGFAFVGIGLLARSPAVGVLSDEVLYNLAPLVHFALGWLGLIIGFQFDVRVLDGMPRGTALQVSLRALIPFLLVGTVGAGLMIAFGRPWSEATFLRDAIVLATAGAIFATGRQDRPRPRVFMVPDEPNSRRLHFLDEIAAIAGLALLGAFFRPRWVAFEWDLPGTVWLLLTIGVGGSIGLLTYAILAGRKEGPDFLALCLGSVALASGIAGYLMLSPLVVCFIAGALLVNLPGEHRAVLWSILMRFERPLYYLFLTLAGALWEVTDWHGWALVPAFLICRIFGHHIADRIAPKLSLAASDLKPAGLAPPISMVSIAIVISAQTIYRGPAIPWIVTAVLGGALVSELLRPRERHS